MDRDKMIEAAENHIVRWAINEYDTKELFVKNAPLFETVADFALQVAIPDAVREERERVISRLEYIDKTETGLNEFEESVKDLLQELKEMVRS